MVMHNESARLRVGEFIGLADEYRASGAAMRHDGAEILQQVDQDLTKFTATVMLKSCDDQAALLAAVERARHELSKEWLKLDHTVDELVSQANHEISRFVTTVEARVDDLERQFRHEFERAQLDEKSRNNIC